MTIFISVLIFMGLADSAYLFWQHRKFNQTGRKMVCPIGDECSVVIESKYGKTFGFNNDLIGILYYIFIGALWLSILLNTDLSMWFWRIIIVSVFGSFVFTNYLLYAQFFIIKKMCFWCLTISFINYALFFSFLWPIL
jgi:uncharacterized membrane protein